MITDLDEAPAVAQTYQQRPWIETLNRDLKSSGFDLENGKITDTDRLSNLLIPVAFAYILLLMLGHAEELGNSPVQLTKGTIDTVSPPPSSQPKRAHSLFRQACNRITDLLERTPLNTVMQFFAQFFDFFTTLLTQRSRDCIQKLVRTYVRQQRLLLEGSQSSVMY